MKRILTTLFALAIIMAGSVPALAAGEETSTGQNVIFYPISVEEYTYARQRNPASTRSISCPCQMTPPASPQRTSCAMAASTIYWT